MNVRSLPQAFFSHPRTQRVFQFFEHPLTSTLFFIAIVILVALATPSCASVGIPNADTFNKKAAVAYKTAETATDLTIDLLKAQKITVDDARAVNTKLQDVRATITAARAGYQTDPTLSENKLLDALKIVNALQLYLQSKNTGS